MNPTVYALCQKPVLGAAMWLASLCSFPPLFHSVPLNIETAEAPVVIPFVVPVDKKYQLNINFVFSSTDARLADKIVGSRYDTICSTHIKYSDIPEQKRAGLGQPIPLRVKIKDKNGGAIVVNSIFETLCLASHDGGKTKTRAVSLPVLLVGSYTAEVIPIEPYIMVPNIKTTLSLVAGNGK